SASCWTCWPTSSRTTPGSRSRSQRRHPMSELFGGLIKRGDAARTATERELHRRVEAWGNRTQFAYRGPADFILQHGHYYARRETPAEYAHLRGELTHCFGNALRVALQYPELTYTEGVYVVLGNVSEHACVTAPDGK